ncbi:hypothetical protein [Mucilaginibacter agri]|uniref:Uncharacterized protein n=1 Tax=Mucilaginibacter agri TaxID=2695265 RepID=A0A965ZEA0_9SPHI|nr:hypothetical protein [Mucilaginibacter agri]NCD69125.1 hypothetical protein [Mucilaginibacter agri]
MKYYIGKNESNETVITYANEILEMEEQPFLTEYLWLKIQTIAGSIIIKHEGRQEERKDKEVKFKKDMLLYKSVMNQIGYDRGIRRLNGNKM